MALVSLHELSPDHETNSEAEWKSAVDIVAVHGLNGDSITAWSAPETGTLWLKDLIPKHIPHARVLSFGYESSSCRFDGPGFVDKIRSLATTLVADLEAYRSLGDCRTRPIIFVCHGLGGVIAKKALAHSANSTSPLVAHLNEIFISTFVILFFGTPHININLANRLVLESSGVGDGRAQRLGYSQSSPPKKLQSLESITDQLAPLMRKFYTTFFWEGMPTDFGGYHDFLVEPASAAPAIYESPKCAIVGTTHSRMVKLLEWSPSYSTVLATLKQYCLKAPGSAKSAPLYALASVNYIGRKEIREQIRQALLLPDTKFIRQSRRRLIVHGIAGSGKSQQCTNFASDTRESYWGIFTIDATSEALAAKYYANIGTIGGLASTESAGKHYLSQAREPWLLIFDNADNPDLQLPNLFPPGDRGHILVTTRNREIQRYGNVGSIELGRLGEEEALHLLLSSAGISPPWDKSTETRGKEIANVFWYYRKKRKQKDSIASGSAREDIYSAFDLSFEHLDRKQTSTSQDAIDILNIVSFFHFFQYTRSAPSPTRLASLKYLASFAGRSWIYLGVMHNISLLSSSYPMRFVPRPIRIIHFVLPSYHSTGLQDPNIHRSTHRLNIMTPADELFLHVPDPPQSRIRRKPVSNPNLHQSYRNDGDRCSSQPLSPTISDVMTASSLDIPPPMPPRPPLRSKASVATIADPYSGRCERNFNSNGWSSASVQRAATDMIPPSDFRTTQSSTSVTMQKAFGEARYLLGGLISRPAESNKHFTILRHSQGVVFYRGSTTSVTISIFSDAPLPPDRSLWLQNKGWTGKTGMRAKALFRLTDDWLDITPTLALRSDQVEPNDERAWQRDIAKFLKKAPSRVRDTHRLRETAAARIPAEAGDGYFQVVLCQGPKKKVLCTSPVFRILSTSLEPSSIRGASLATLPLEVGAMVLGLYAQTAAQTVINPATSLVQSTIQPLKPSWVTQTAAETAYGIGMSMRSSDDDSTQGPAAAMARGQQEAISLETGPSPPYPMSFKARAEAIQGESVYDMQRMRLSKVPDLILDRLHGFFFGWARLLFARENGEWTGSQWYQAILAIRNLDLSQQTHVNMSQVMKRVTTVRFLEEVELPVQSRVEVRVLGFLRPDMPPPRGITEEELLEARNAAAEAAMLADACDASYAQNVLDHPAWGPDSQREAGVVGRAKEGIENIWARGQKVVERVPLHWLGVRSPTAEMRDRQITMNGFYVVR
ncbi:LipA and NB-ARC domain-containing protein [Aspergillus fumigatus Z5]|nr:LipA and NB-ARC domain-containing protein [Aspergillus fumigatus Z5]